MTRSSRYQYEAQKRLRLKKTLDIVFFALIGVPFLSLLGLSVLGKDVEIYLTKQNIVFWLGIYGVLFLLYHRNWKCPRCEKSLSRPGEKVPVARPSCRHCGEMLFPEVKNKTKVKKENLGMRPLFFVMILLLALGALGFGFYVDSMQIKGIGVGILFICLLVKLALKRISSCPHCGHASLPGKFCEQCGGKLPIR